MFSKFEFCGYLNLWVFKICGYSNLWVHKICDDAKFQVSGREYQNICVLCISCEQKNICAFFHICFLPYVENIPCELAFRCLGPVDCSFVLLNLNSLLIIRQIDNTSTGTVAGQKLAPSSHSRKIDKDCSA